MTASAMAPPLRLPNGYAIRLREDLLVKDEGKLLVGGSPVRSMRLTRQALELFAGTTLTVGSEASARLARRLLEGNLALPVPLAQDEDPDQLTVVIPVRDRPEQLDRCLASLTPLNVIVVDDASHHPQEVRRVAEDHGAELVVLERNLGPAGARNAGLERVRTPLVAFVDSDVEARAADLLAIARHCQDPQLALVAPRVEGHCRSPRPRWFERFDTAASSLDLGTRSSQVNSGAEVGWLPSACLVGRTNHLRGGFQDSWRVAEDVDLVWRLIDQGFVVRYDATVAVRHDVRATVRSWLGRKFLYGTGGALLAKRHGDKVAPAVLSLPMALGAAALLQGRWWSLPLAALIIAGTARSLYQRIPQVEGSGMIALRLSLRGLGWAVRQEGALLLRHWWPAAFLASLVSPAVRRIIVTALMVDLAIFLRDRPSAGILTSLLGRRLDDMAYGAGLWWGAIRDREPRCLKIRWVKGEIGWFSQITRKFSK